MPSAAALLFGLAPAQAQVADSAAGKTVLITDSPSGINRFVRAAHPLREEERGQSGRATRWILRTTRQVEVVGADSVREKTDLLVRLGPALGLAGTLIPLGSGLAALGRGEIQASAQALTIAFDTTILGIVVGAAALVLSSVRRRWFEGYMLRATASLEDALAGAEEEPAEPFPAAERQSARGALEAP